MYLGHNMRPYMTYLPQNVNVQGYAMYEELLSTQCLLCPIL